MLPHSHTREAAGGPTSTRRCFCAGSVPTVYVLCALDGVFAEEAALFRSRWAEACAFEIEQEFLCREAAAESGQTTVGGDDSMARHNDGNRVVMVRLTYRSRGKRRSNFSGELGVGPSLSVRDAQECLPATLVEFGTAQIEWEVKRTALSRKVLIQLAGYIAKTIGLLDPARVPAAMGNHPPAMKRNRHQAALAHGKVEVANRRVIPGGKQKLRWLGK